MMRHMFRSVQLWVVCLLAIVWVVGTFAFGVVVHKVEQNVYRPGPAGQFVRDLVRTPETLRKLWRNFNDPGSAFSVPIDRFAGQAGFSFSDLPGAQTDRPYLMLNRYDGDIDRSVSELVDLSLQKTVARWVYEVDPIWQKSEFKSRIWTLTSQSRSNRFAGVHAFLTEDGDVIVNGMNTPLLAFGPCGDLLWEQASAAFHHSIERDEDGNFWVPSHMEPKTLPIGGPELLQDTVTQLGPDGTVLFRKLVVDILSDNGLGYLIYGHGFSQDDPVHLNDIEPVRTDGVIWRKGDVFLSLRNRSLVLLYRPSTGRVIWSMAGDDAWLHQHDVAIVDDHTITVFDNRAPLRGIETLRTDGVNRLVRADLLTGQLAPIDPAAFESLDLHTGQQGRGALLADGNVFVEETEYGRVLVFGADGQVDWSYVNRATNGTIYSLNWSRLVPRELGDMALAHITAAGCAR